MKIKNKHIKCKLKNLKKLLMSTNISLNMTNKNKIKNNKKIKLHKINMNQKNKNGQNI